MAFFFFTLKHIRCAEKSTCDLIYRIYGEGELKVMEDKKIEKDPLYIVKTHGRPFEPMDFETYRGQYDDVLEDEKIEKWLKKEER